MMDVITTCVTTFITALVAYFMNTVNSRIQKLEQEIKETPTEAEVRQIVDDKIEPIKDDIEEIKDKINKIYDILIYGKHHGKTQ